MDPAPLIDPEQLSAIAGMDPEPIIGLYEDFGPQTATALQGITALLQNGDLTGARGELHKLKGSAGSLGLPALHQHFAHLEGLVLQGETPPPDLLAHTASLISPSLQEALSYLRS